VRAETAQRGVDRVLVEQTELRFHDAILRGARSDATRIG